MLKRLKQTFPQHFPALRCSRSRGNRRFNDVTTYTRHSDTLAEYRRVALKHRTLSILSRKEYGHLSRYRSIPRPPRQPLTWSSLRRVGRLEGASIQHPPAGHQQGYSLSPACMHACMRACVRTIGLREYYTRVNARVHAYHATEGERGAGGESWWWWWWRVMDCYERGRKRETEGGREEMHLFILRDRMMP